ncbi:MAG: hypothetical protein RBT70_09615 [Alphaproteobacteria bacterium]|jgi:hypothetical protein|nr:hypothetical protein [Alphaproteobacteria bacterium]
MKIKASVKAIARPRKPPKRWPRFFKRILGQLDIAADDPVFLDKADITDESQPLVSSLVTQGLLSEEPTNAIACISCDATATVRRKGAKGEMALALCPCCGTIFQTNGKELRRWRADWNSLGLWIKNTAGTDGEMEAVSSEAFFLGHHTKEQERFEIYLAMSLSDPSLAKQPYSVISQSINGSGVVLSIADHFSKPTNPKIRAISLADCLVLSDTGFAFTWPEHVFAGKDWAKQQAGLTRAQNDPKQKQKEILKVFVRQKITGVFADKYHHQIADEIVNKHTGQIAYKDSKGKSQQLSRRMTLDAVAEIMRENGLEDWISGKPFKH